MIRKPANFGVRDVVRAVSALLEGPAANPLQPAQPAQRADAFVASNATRHSIRVPVERKASGLAPHALRALGEGARGFAAGGLTPPSASLPKQASSNAFLAAVEHHMAAAAAALGLGRDELEALSTPERTIAVSFPVELESGEARTLQGWRIQQSTRRGPGKGGIRFAPLTAETVGALAAEMPTKPAIYGLPLGGAKGGVDVDPRALGTRDRCRVMRSYIRAVMDAEWAEGRLALGPHIDVPAPDVGTNPAAIDSATDVYLQWLVEHGIESVGDFAVPVELRSVEPARDPAETPFLDRYVELFDAKKIAELGLASTFTGKSVAKGGSAGRVEATGLGVAFSVLEAMKAHGHAPAEATRFSSDTTVAIQGFGNVGIGAAQSFTALGAKVSAIAEFDGASYAIEREDGFDLDTLSRLEAHKKETGTLRSFPGVRLIDMDTFWSSPVSILAPCAREGELDGEKATLVQAPFIVEGANGPTTPEADEVLQARGKVVVPDVYANAAGVTVSYFEMLQNQSGERWSLEKVRGELHRLLQDGFKGLREVQAELGLKTLRDAAYATAVRGILEG